MNRYMPWLRIWLFVCSLCAVMPLIARPILRENMQQTNPGDFLVAMQGKLATLLLVHAKDDSILTLEEVMMPMRSFPQGTRAWQQWLTDRAPGHSCWVRYRINLATGKIIDYYSFTQNEWQSISQAESLLPTLLSLDFNLVPLPERKKIGPQPMVATHDPRPIWQPPLYFDGQKVEGAVFDVWRSYWPHDNSELAGRLIEIYLPQSGSSHIAHFPYWLEVQGLAGRAKVRVFDTGHDLKSLYPTLRNTLIDN